MGLADGDILELDEKLTVLNHWIIASKALKCASVKNGKIWFATESSGLFVVDFNKKTIANPLKKTKLIKELTASSNGRYIGIVVDPPGEKFIARIYSVDSSSNPR
ncbi:hypothetical protein MNBD_GAMMA11-1440 [hydrothermal vent metagenome]|uniref:Uncharacterized protein n=1 Tax=hydrothermal vent metagenome TaxID=652676 RepID=A0A3B0X914_9ZZZZ